MTEQINKIPIIDETLNFISPEIIAESDSPDRVLPILKLSQLALSVFHPDQQLEISDDSQDKGVQALTRINTLVKSFENDQELSEIFYSTSREIADDIDSKIHVENSLLDSILALREQIKVREEYLANTNSQIESTGIVVEQVANQKLLALILGSRVLSLLANSGEASISRIMPALKKKFLKEANNPFGIKTIEWITAFDEIQNTGKIDGTQITIDNNSDLIGDNILDSLKSKRFQAFNTLIDLLKPNESLKYPENWYRSFDGKIVCPTSLNDWPRYEDYTVLNHDVELRVFDVHEVESGIVKSSLKLDTSARESIELIKDIEDEGQKKWLKSIINNVALSIGYEANKFTKQSEENGSNNPMDFIFEVTEDNKINIIYTRPRNEKSDTANTTSLSFDDVDFPKNSNPLESGFYMVKAGKNSKTNKYNVNPPLALIKLIPEHNDQLVGTAFIGGETIETTGADVANSIRKPDLTEMPALLGRKISFDRKRLFNMFNFFTKIIFQDNRKSMPIEKAFASEFINDDKMLYHLTFIDDGDFLYSEDESGISNKSQGRVFSQTTLFGHRARLIKSK